MFNMLVDTCVWLDVAKDRSQLPLLDLMDEMIRLDLLRLLVPTTVLEEFQRNRDRVAQESSSTNSICLTRVLIPRGVRCEQPIG